jgi:rare lipoprotein A
MFDRRYANLTVLTACVVLAACARQDPAARPAEPAPGSQSAAAPKPKLPAAQSGTASYYGPEFAGKETASGQPHDPAGLTAASPTLPLGTTAKVTNKETGKSVRVEVNDRGPYAKGRIVDVSPKAAAKLGMTDDGVAKVKVQPLSVPGAKRPGG